MNTEGNRDLLTVKDVCEMFGCSESSLTTNFKRTAQSIRKKYHVVLAKMIIESGTYYYILEDKSNSLTIYEGDKDIFIPVESLGFEAYEFFIFLAISATEFGVYRGTRDNLLKYVGIKPDKKNIETLNQVIDMLVQKQVIKYQQDQNYIVLYLPAGVQKEYSVSVTMLRECQKIANENHKNFNKLAQLIQVWEAVKICEKNQPFTYADLTRITGLSYKQIRDVKKLLESNNAFITTRAGSYFKCLGMNVDMNAFYN